MSPPDMPPEDEYLCVGICMPEPDSGYCLGCGRPPIPVSTGGQPDEFEAFCAERVEAGTSQTSETPERESAANLDPSKTP
jgi:hypothetical protein